MFTAPIIEAVKAAADIVTLIGREVKLTRKGRYHWGLSPFRQEKTPSFAVDAERGTWRCYATNQGGDVFSYLMLREGLTFPDAVRAVADAAGYELKETPAAHAAGEKSAVLRAILAGAAEYYSSLLEGEVLSVGAAETSPWAAYLAERQITPSMITDGRLGIAGQGWSGLCVFLGGRGYAEEQILAAGLAVRAKNGKLVDRFRDRLIFPITDYVGNVVALAGRRHPADTTQQGKYVNSPETELYTKGRHLYGLGLPGTRDAIRAQGMVYLVEGYLDVLTMRASGILNVVSVSGTALTEQQITLLRRFTAHVVLCLDSDGAGEAATEKVLPALLAADMRVSMLRLPAGEDPDSWIRAGHTLPEPADWLADWVTIHPTPADTADRAAHVGTLVDLIRSLPTDLEQGIYAADAARLLHLREQVILSAVAGRPVLDALSVTPTDPYTVRDAAYLAMVRDVLGISQDSTLYSEGSQVVTHYRNGPRYITPPGASDERVPLGLQVQGLWCSPHLYDMLLNGETGSMLVMTEDAISAAILGRMEIPAVGLSWREAWLQRRGGKKALHDLGSDMRVIDARHLVLLLPADAWALPTPPEGVSVNPYEQTDAASIAQEWADLLVVLKSAMSDFVVHIVWPTDTTLRRQPYWLDRMVIESHRAWDEAGGGEDLLQALPRYIRAAAIGMELPGNPLEGLILSDYSRDKYLQVLHADTPQAFYDFHGAARLGSAFQYERKLYEVDRDGKVRIRKEATEAQAVVRMDGQYWARRKTGLDRVSDFVLHPVLQIVGQGGDPYVLTRLKGRSGVTWDFVMIPGTMTNADAFHLKVFAGAGCFFLGKKEDLLAIQELEFKGMPLAYQVNSLGHTEIEATGGKTVRFYAMGNGVIDYTAGWIPADDRGLLKVGGITVFLPAASSYRISASQDVEYDTHRRMAYRPGQIGMRAWLDKVMEVHPRESAHITFAFAVMSLYRSEIRKHIGPTMPALFVVGPTGKGKTAMRKSISRLWGDPPVMSIAGKPTQASVGSFPRQVRDGVVAFEEYNLFLMMKDGQGFIADVVKSSYDDQGRAVRTGGHSDYVKNVPPTAALILIGQEAIYQADPAYHNRLVIQEFPVRNLTQESKRKYEELKDIEAQGLGHILEELVLYRPLVAEQLLATQRQIETELKDALAQQGTEALDRIIQNWSIVLAPLVILVKAGKIDYPLSLAAIKQHAVQGIISHAQNSVRQGAMGEWWSFLQSEYGQSLDDRQVFVWEKKGEKELRLRFTECYERFAQHLTRKGDKSIQLPSRTSLLDQLRKNSAFAGETQTWMGFVRNQEGRIMTAPNLEGKFEPRLAKLHCMRFRLADPAETEKGRDHLLLEFAEMDYGQPNTEEIGPPSLALMQQGQEPDDSLPPVLEEVGF